MIELEDIINEMETNLHNTIQTIRYKIHKLVTKWGSNNSGENNNVISQTTSSGNMDDLQWMQIIENHIYRLNSMLDNALNANGLKFDKEEFDRLEKEYNKELFSAVTATNPMWLTIMMLLANNSTSTDNLSAKNDLDVDGINIDASTVITTNTLDTTTNTLDTTTNTLDTTTNTAADTTTDNTTDTTTDTTDTYINMDNLDDDNAIISSDDFTNNYNQLSSDDIQFENKIIQGDNGFGDWEMLVPVSYETEPSNLNSANTVNKKTKLKMD